MLTTRSVRVEVSSKVLASAKTGYYNDDPMICPDGHTVASHARTTLPCGYGDWDANLVSVHSNRYWSRSYGIPIREALREIEPERVLNVNWLNFVLDHPEREPESWKEFDEILFLGTVYDQNPYQVELCTGVEVEIVDGNPIYAKKDAQVHMEEGNRGICLALNRKYVKECADKGWGRADYDVTTCMLTGDIYPQPRKTGIAVWNK